MYQVRHVEASDERRSLVNGKPIPKYSHKNGWRTLLGIPRYLLAFKFLGGLSLHFCRLENDWIPGKAAGNPLMVHTRRGCRISRNIHVEQEGASSHRHVAESHLFSGLFISSFLKYMWEQRHSRWVPIVFTRDKIGMRVLRNLGYDNCRSWSERCVLHSFSGACLLLFQVCMYDNDGLLIRQWFETDECKPII